LDIVTNSIDLLRGIVEKERAWINAFGHPRLPFDRAYCESLGYEKMTPGEHAANLEHFSRIAPYLVPRNQLLHKPVLRHPDLQPNNIFLSDDLKIVGLIDWQHSSVLPQFLSAGIPKYFQNYEDEESIRFIVPKLPPDLDEMDEGARNNALEQYRRRHLHFYYVAFSERFNPGHHEALDLPTNLLIRKAFSHAAEPWEGNNIPLQADLIHIKQAWQEILRDNGHEHVQCPVNFDQAEAERIIGILEEQEKTDTQMSTIRDYLGINVDGWTPTSNFDEAVEQAAMIKKEALEGCETEEERGLVARHWPLDDFDEET
jgi:hypothetical protein